WRPIAGRRKTSFLLGSWDGAPEEIRTPDPQIRSLVLYPAELRAPGAPEPGPAGRGKPYRSSMANASSASGPEGAAQAIRIAAGSATSKVVPCSVGTWTSEPPCA